MKTAAQVRAEAAARRKADEDAQRKEQMARQAALLKAQQEADARQRAAEEAQRKEQMARQAALLKAQQEAEAKQRAQEAETQRWIAMAAQHRAAQAQQTADAWTNIEVQRAQASRPPQMSLADWKQRDMHMVAQLTGRAPVSWQNMGEADLVTRYQQDQGATNYCGTYAISTALNMLYDTNTSGLDVVNAFTQIPGNILTRWPLYSWLPDGGAVLPYQQALIVNQLAGTILGQRENLPVAETRNLTPQEMIEIVMNPNQVAVFSFNTETGDIFSGHAVVLAAYDPDPAKGFGFLNSGALKPEGEDDDKLTWISREKMQSYIQDPIGLWNPNFVVISRQP